MKKIGLGQLLTILANIGVILGILLLVYELNQARDFARIDFVAGNDAIFQEIEREMMNPDVASIWVKSAIDPVSMSPTEIRVMDAFLINLYNFWQQRWVLERAGFIEIDQNARDFAADIPFYFGSAFARVWWEDLKANQVQGEGSEFNARIDEILADANSSANREYIERIQRLVEERVANEAQSLNGN